MKDFLEFAADFRSVAALIGKAALAAPFIEALHIGPPWPGAQSVPALAALAEVLVLIYVFQFYSRRSRKRLEKHLRAHFLVIAGCFVIYASLYSVFVYDVPVGGRDIRGFIVRPDIEQILGPLLTIDAALEGAAWDPEAVYTKWSVHATRVAMLFLWIVFFGAIAACIATFVTLQRRASAARAP